MSTETPPIASKWIRLSWILRCIWVIIRWDGCSDRRPISHRGDNLHLIRCLLPTPMHAGGDDEDYNDGCGCMDLELKLYEKKHPKTDDNANLCKSRHRTCIQDKERGFFLLTYEGRSDDVDHIRRLRMTIYVTKTAQVTFNITVSVCSRKRSDVSC